MPEQRAIQAVFPLLTWQASPCGIAKLGLGSPAPPLMRSAYVRHLRGEVVAFQW
ncbi:hypothetical protein M441DRAFT_56285 [Trichoderma asperellum CBS 433.97]|uniref:Uncharacterized protein n=1 Tax=Trichoderma asperellum (strain ATCC 204424 / CBS 433.97 / NBRC 101777) TaxID=1042311 RepID=A0A2T3ZEM9_TRIA4|nr:hypothetical protein M441DRAFT_56285 [Trichoderma asperellum CBS 433.97]PTB43255.1 hypothetical protein M441DRAFT_56285 [Trichoderma asperellum CBS 433.97]